MYSCSDTHILIWVRSRIRISTALRLFATPRGFSQLVTSFFGAWCQGIHRTLFFRLVIHTYRYVFLPEIKKLSFQSLFSFFLQDIYFDTSFFTRRFRMFYVLCFLLVLAFLLLLVSMFTFFSLFAVVNVRKCFSAATAANRPQKGTAWLVYHNKNIKSRVFNNFFREISLKLPNTPLIISAAAYYICWRTDFKML